MSPRLATFLVFAVNGAMMGTWVAHIPWLQDHLGISKATLGLCLLCMAAGAMIAMPLTGLILERRPSASVTRWSALVFCLLLPLPMLAEGAIGDWSGIYLKHNTGASTAAAAVAFTGFSLGMAIARLGGDFVTPESVRANCCVSGRRWWQSRSERCS